MPRRRRHGRNGRNGRHDVSLPAQGKRYPRCGLGAASAAPFFHGKARRAGISARPRRVILADVPDGAAAWTSASSTSTTASPTAASAAAQFLDRLADIAGSSAAALALLPLAAKRLCARRDRGARRRAARHRHASAMTPAARRSTAILARLQAEGQAAGGHRHPREPRAQSAHPGRRAPHRARRLPGLRRRHALAARRHAGRRGQGARHDRHAQSPTRRRTASPPPCRFSSSTRNRPARSAPSASAGAAAWSIAGGDRARARRRPSPITARSRRPIR